MILAAHQPSYIPWLGYLDKMARADVFVVMDDLQYEAQNYQNRQRIKLNNGAGWLTVPLERGSRNERICDKRINNQSNPKQHWQRRTWLSIEHHYKKTPFFSDYADALYEKIFSQEWDRLVDLDLAMLTLARQWFDITTPITLSSELNLQGEKTDRILDMCRKMKADVYLSGRGGSESYLDTDLLGRAGINVQWQTFHHPEYPQRYPKQGFVPYLAFLDLLFNCGPSSKEYIGKHAEETLSPSLPPLLEVA